MFEFPMRRPHPLTANLLGRTEARRGSCFIPSRDPGRGEDLCSPGTLDQPLAQGFFGQTAPGGRVDLEENDESTTL